MKRLGVRLEAVPARYLLAYVLLLDVVLAAGMFPLERLSLQTAFFDAQNTPLLTALLFANFGLLVALFVAMAASGIAVRRGLDRLRRFIAAR